jgi:pSer/pThr/pTyr-binding forkhead associated (FHA) protein
LPPFALTVLKWAFLALLYFFVYRAIRWAALDLRAAPATTVRRAEPREQAPARPRRSPGKPPRAVVVTDERGNKVSSQPLQDGPLNIGRGESCQIQVSDTYVSAAHARIYRSDGSWYVEDLGSTNGTYLNQRRVTTPAELRAGDRVRVGKTTLELKR